MKRYGVNGEWVRFDDVEEALRASGRMLLVAIAEIEQLHAVRDELLKENERARTDFARYATHRTNCHTVGSDGCSCGYVQVLSRIYPSGLPGYNVVLGTPAAHEALRSVAEGSPDDRYPLDRNECADLGRGPSDGRPAPKQESHG